MRDDVTLPSGLQPLPQPGVYAPRVLTAELDKSQAPELYEEMGHLRTSIQSTEEFQISLALLDEQRLPIC